MRAVLLAVVLALLGVVRPVAADEIYFPPGVWGPPDQESGESQAQWDAWYNSFHGRVLKALHERPLWDERAAAGAAPPIRAASVGSNVESCPLPHGNRVARVAGPLKCRPPRRAPPPACAT